ncbi:MAG: ribokinase [Acidobacteriaceae bacterium]|nr:ribokinase [Acidobacteriaceae bacterium]MBV9501855.1 ribokinase [Acidobacteriaceae bacterium]
MSRLPAKKILVLGSLNIDLVQPVGRVPEAGETIRGADLQIYVGGKGANQACAAALLGGNVQMAGMIGNDVFGARLLAELQEAGVDTSLVQAAETASGSAIIFVLPNGENRIVISPGANAAVTGTVVKQAIDSLEAGDFLLCQLEIPIASVMEAMRPAYKKGVITILDPAPVCDFSDDVFRSVRILTPNQIEAGLLLGEATPIGTLAEAERCARKLQARGVETVVVKMGEQGSFVAGQNESFVAPGFEVTAVDTTAAGDAFNGAFAVALREGLGSRDAARFANAAAGLSVTRNGALKSMPNRLEVDQFLASKGPSA